MRKPPWRNCLVKPLMIWNAVRLALTGVDVEVLLKPPPPQPKLWRGDWFPGEGGNEVRVSWGQELTRPVTHIFSGSVLDRQTEELRNMEGMSMVTKQRTS